MKAALMVSLPDPIRARLDDLAGHYGVDADQLCQFWLVNVISNVWVEQILELRKREKEARE